LSFPIEDSLTLFVKVLFSMAMRLESEKTNMLMRAVFASAMLIGLAGTAHADIK